jgi:protocatechuate 3,4-dioxygenase beta subunit
LIHKLRLVVMTVLALAAIATGAGYFTRSLAMKEEPVKDPAAQVAQRVDGRPEPTAKPDPATPARMTATGRVLDPDGKPVKGAFVDVIGGLRTPWVGASEDVNRFTVLGQAESDADGRFRFDAPRTTSSRVPEILAIAAAPGFGRGVGRLNPDAERPEATIRLHPEEIHRARLLELTGAPAKGVVVHIHGFWRPDPAGEANTVGAWVGDGPPPPGLRTWPGPVKSDDQGRITLTGFGRGFSISGQVRDVPYARQEMMFDAGRMAEGKETTFALLPARVIEGRVLAADTGQPIPNAVVSAPPTPASPSPMPSSRPRPTCATSTPTASSRPSSAPTTRAGSS